MIKTDYSSDGADSKNSHMEIADEGSDDEFDPKDDNYDLSEDDDYNLSEDDDYNLSEDEYE